MQATIDHVLESPCEHPNGLDWYQDTLWLVGGDRKVYQLDPDTGNVLKEIQTPGHAGLLHAGTHVWVVELPKIFKVHPDTGETLGELDPTGPVPIGLAWDGDHLWCGEHHHGICKMDVADNKVLQQFAGQGERTHDLAWDGQALWFGDTNLKQIYRMDVQDGSILDSFPTPEGIEPHGLTWDGKTLWFTGCSPNRIYRLRLVR